MNHGIQKAIVQPQMDSPERAHAAQKSGATKRIARFLLSYGVAGVCLYWVFHDLDFHALFHSYRGVNWWLIGPAIVLQLLVYVAAGWEWKILLRRVGQLSIQQTTRAVFAGRFANDVLPVHVGYVVRVYLVARWTGKKIAAVIPSLLIERLFDGLWLALGIGATALYFPLPGKIAGMAKVWAAIIGFGLLATGAILVRRRSGTERSRRWLFRWQWARKALEFGGQLVKEVRAIGRSWRIWAALAISFLKLALQCLAFLCVLWAYGFHLTVWVQLAVFMIAYVGISMPSTPASVGVFQLFCIAGLEMFHAPKPAATGFAMLAFAVLTVPLSVAGFFALAQSGLTLSQVRSEAGRWKFSAE